MNKIPQIFKKAYLEGDFLLHSGQKSKFLFDVMKLIGDEEFQEEFSDFVRNDDFLVGIEFGGAILVAMDSNYLNKFAIIRKDGTIYGNPIPDNYVLLDDVVTTEQSAKTATEHIGRPPKKIKCIIDRRRTKSLKIESMLQFEDK